METFLVQNALRGLYNPQFAQFVACNYTSMRDKKNVHDVHGFELDYSLARSRERTGGHEASPRHENDGNMGLFGGMLRATDD